jgi:hypothetical protein
MNKKGFFFFFAKKWTNIGPNQESTTMFFSRTQKTLSKNQEKTSHETTTAKPRNEHFWPLKHAFFIPKKSLYHTQTYLNQKNKNKKHQNTKIKHEISNPKTNNLK